MRRAGRILLAVSLVALAASAAKSLRGDVIAPPIPPQPAGTVESVHPGSVERPDRASRCLCGHRRPAPDLHPSR